MRRIRYIQKWILVFMTMMTALPVSAIDDSRNYVSTIEPLVAGNTIGRTTVVYFDGLGRQKSTVHEGFGINNADVADLTYYDQRGRVCRQYLPLADGGSFSDNYPYTETLYDGTADNRPSELIGPGEQWRSQNGNHSIKTIYAFNKADYICIDQYNDLYVNAFCEYYYINNNGILVHQDTYNNDRLKIEVTINEDSAITMLFTDKAGRKVLQRQTDIEWDDRDTYFIYDQYGRLTYILPPEASKQLSANGACNIDVVNKYCYRYTYDDLDRIIEKKLPGCAPVYYVYDKLNRPIMSQDGEQRLLGEWTVTKYDSSMRVAVEGRSTNHMSRSTLQSQWGDTLLLAAFDPTLLMESTLMYTATPGLNFLPDRAYYYDSYSFWENYVPLPTEPGYENATQYSARGLMTGTAVTDFSGSVTVMANAYDKRGRLVMKAERDCYADSYLLRTFMKYDFAGRCVEKKRIYSTMASQVSQADYAEHWTYMYDNWDRLTQATHAVGNRPAVTLASYTYDDNGRVNSYTFGGQTANTTTYTYNLRGWLTEQQSSHYAAELYYTEDVDNIGVRYFGGNVAAISENRCVPLYQGNYMWGSQWRTIKYDSQGQLLQTSDDYSQLQERFSYDLNGNVTHIVRGSTRRPYDNVTLTYDGNFIVAAADAGTDNYLGNIPQYAGNLFYHDADFAYDSCGRVTRDMSRGVSEVTYNPIGLPQRIEMGDDMRVALSYRADGVKTAEHTYRYYTETVVNINHLTGLPDTVQRRRVDHRHRQYRDDHELEDGNMRIYNEAGYVDIDRNDSVSYHYMVRDRLGSVRAIIDGEGTLEQALCYTASGLPYTTYGLPTDRHMHTGLEQLNFGGLGWYDNHARWYDPVSMRFTTPDPLAEKYFHITPFANCANNPIRYTDPTGEEKIISYNPHDEEHENNDTPKYMAKIYPDDDAIHIFAHGSKKGIWIYRDGKDVLINNSDDFQALLSEKSFIWRNRKNGEKITIILHSCKTGYGEDSFAERMSKELENTTIIAPNENLVQNKYSGLNAVFETEIIGDGKNKWANPIRQGQWKVFEEGKVIATYLGIWKPKLPTSFIDNFYKINK